LKSIIALYNYASYYNGEVDAGLRVSCSWGSSHWWNILHLEGPQQKPR